MKIAIIQNMPGFNKSQNLKEVRDLIPKEEVVNSYHPL